MSFRLKTILGIAVIEAVLLTILVTSVLTMLENSNYEHIDRYAHTTAQLFGTGAQDSVIAYDLANLESLTQQMLAQPGLHYVRIQDRDGRVLSQAGEEALLNRPFVADSGSRHVNDGIYDYRETITVSGIDYGYIELGFATNDLDALFQAARNHSLSIAVVEMLLVAIFSAILGSYLVRQLLALKQGARQLADGNLGYTIPISSNDELGQVTAAFNDMSQRLNDAAKRRNAMMGASPEPVLILNSEGEVVEANAAAISKLSNDGHLIGLSVEEFLWEGKREQPFYLSKHLSEGPALPCLSSRVGETRRRYDASLKALGNHDAPLYILYLHDVTELLKRGERLALFSRIIQQNPVGVVLTDDTHHITYINDAALAIAETGYDQAIGRVPSELFGVSDKNLISEAVALIERGYDWSATVLSDRQSDNRVWLSMTISPVRDEDGVIRHYSATVQDISEQKRHEEQLRYDEAFQRLLLNGSGEGIYGVNTDGICTFCNPMAAQLLGYDSPDRLIGQHIHELTHHHYPDGSPYPASKCRVYQAYVTGQPQHVVGEVFWRPDGNSFPVDYSAFPLTENDKVVGTVVNFNDITERKANELNLKKLSQAVEFSPASVVITDRTGTIEYVNKQFTEISGYSEAEAIGTTPRILRSGQTPDAVYKDLWKTILSGHNWHGELYNKKKSGQFYWEKVSIAPIRSREGEISHFVAVKEDITERKMMSEKIWHQANYDQLTGLANREHFYAELSNVMHRKQRSGGNFALLFVDLDRFKPINDQYGHDVGDKLLREAARRMVSAIRNVDLVARIGGDEFTIILDDIETDVNAATVAEKLLSAIGEPYLLDNQHMEIGASIGIAVYPQHGQDFDLLIRRADEAMYMAKQAGRNCAVLFQESAERSA